MNFAALSTRNANPPDDAAASWVGHHVRDGLEHHGEAWDALNRACFGNHPLLDSRFWSGVLRHFGQAGVMLWVLRAATGPLAMCLLIHKGWGRWTTYLPSQAQLGPLMFSDRRQVDSLFRALRPIAVQIDLLCVDPAVSDLTPLPTQSAHVKMHALTMNVKTDGRFDGYWSRRSSNLQKNFRRHERKAATLRLQRRCITAPEAMFDAVQRYASLETRGWKGEEGTALTAENAQTRFYTELLIAHANSGQALIQELWADDRLAASRLIIQSGGMQVILKTSYDEELAQYSPGQLLLHSVLQHAFEDSNCNVVELYTNASQSQRAWADELRWIRHVTYYAPQLLGMAFHGLWLTHKLVRQPRSNKADSTLHVDMLRIDEDWPADVLKLMAGTATHALEASTDWYKNLWMHIYQQHPETRLWVLRSASEALAAIPVAVDRVGARRELRVLTNYYTALYTPGFAPHLAASQLAQLMRHLRQHYQALGQLHFEPMDPMGDGFHLLQEALQLAGFVGHRYFRFTNWYLPTPGRYADYMLGRSINLRSNMKRSLKRLAEIGGRVEVLTQADQLERGLEAYWHVYRRSWKKEEPYPNFVDGLAAWCGKQGSLRLGLVWLEGKPIAAQIWLVSGGKASIFKMAYDNDFKHLSPGSVLSATLMQHVLDHDNAIEVDYLIGDDNYKRHWMSHQRERWGLIAYNPYHLKGALGIARSAIRQVARRFWRRSASSGSTV